MLTHFKFNKYCKIKTLFLKTLYSCSFYPDVIYKRLTGADRGFRKRGGASNSGRKTAGGTQGEL